VAWPAVSSLVRSTLTSAWNGLLRIANHLFQYAL
jgi:hypothetical protein